MVIIKQQSKIAEQDSEILSLRNQPTQQQAAEYSCDADPLADIPPGIALIASKAERVAPQQNNETDSCRQIEAADYSTGQAQHTKVAKHKHRLIYDLTVRVASNATPGKIAKLAAMKQPTK